MRRKKRAQSLLAAALALAAGVVLWFALGGTLFAPAAAPLADGEEAAAPAPDAAGALAPDAAREGSLEGRKGVRGKPVEEAPEAAPAPAFSKGEGVWGRILDTKEKPIAGAVVTLHVLDPAEPWGAPLPPALATGTAGDDGAYVVGPAPAGTRLRVRAEAPTYAATIGVMSARGARVDLVLDRGGALRLLVKDVTGAPVKGAEVRVLSYTRASLPTTSAAGEALLEGLPTGATQVRITAAGQAPVQMNDLVVEPGKTVERTCVVGRGIAVAGRATDESGLSGIEGVEVTAKPQNDQNAAVLPPVKTDAEGRFRLESAGGPNEWVNVTAVRDGYATTTQTVRLQAFAGEAQEVTLKLSRGGDTDGPSGTVVDADAHAVAGARVVYSGQPRQLDGTPGPTATTDAEGRFSLRLPAGTGKAWSFVLGAFAAGRGMGATQVHSSKPGSVTIRLGGAGTVTGKVTGAGGEALEGAAVTLTYDWNARITPIVGGDAQPWLYPQLFWDPRAPPLAATTDASGTFRIEGVPMGAFTADAAWGLDRANASETVTVRAGASETVAIALGKGKTIEGRVLDTSGAPIAGASVNGFDPANNDPRQVRSAFARSDGDGVFRLRNVQGDRWTLNASAAGYAYATLASVSPGDRGIDLKMTPLGWIEGQVLLDGAPYAGGYTVSAQLLAPAGEEGNVNMKELDFGNDRMYRGRGGRTSGDSNRSDTFSSADGRFTLRGLAAGPWRLNVTTTENWIPQAPVEASVSDGRPTSGVEVRLIRGASITGVLSEEGGATLVAGGQVSLRIKGTATTGGLTRGGSTTDARGRYTASGLAGGTYLLVATTPGGLYVEDEIRLDPGQAVVRDVTAPRPGALLVTVLDPAGAAAPGVQVTLQTASDRTLQPNWELLRKQNLVDLSRPDSWQRIQQTDAQGKNQRWHVPPGRIKVTARHPSGKPVGGPVYVDVQSDRTAEVTLTLETEMPPPR